MSRFQFHHRGWPASQILLLVAAVSMMLVVTAVTGQAQSYRVIYDFAPSDGNPPTGTLLLDRAGHLYGTMEDGQYGTCGYYGIAFQMKHVRTNWIYNPIHCFTAPLGGDDGAFPINHGGLRVGPDGNLYGTSEEGGIQSGSSSQGVVYKISPPLTVCVTALCPWRLTVLYKFRNSPDGAYPHGNIGFDSVGNIYGTTYLGGAQDEGTVFQLAPSGGGWSESVIHSFVYPLDLIAEAGVVADAAGNVYGVSVSGGNGFGDVFKLTRSSGWTYHQIYTFSNGSDGNMLMAGLVMDQAGNLYGATLHGGSGLGGTVFQLSPSGGGWTFSVLCSFSGSGGPESALTMDAQGNLYGTNSVDGNHAAGSVFKVSRSGDSWTCTDLHDFDQGSDGRFPIGGVTVAPNGSLYGTTSAGGAHGQGVVWEITP